MGQIMDWMKTQEVIEKINQKYNQAELDENMMELKKAYAEQVNKVDKSDMVMMSADRDDHTIIDPLLDEIKDTIWDQQKKVLRSGKYKHKIHKDNHTALEWMHHQMSEFADALVYHQCMKQTIHDVIYLIGQAQEWNKETRADKSDIVDAILGDALKRLRG